MSAWTRGLAAIAVALGGFTTKPMDTPIFPSDRDVMFKICVRCDDDALWKLYLLVSPVLVSQVLSTQHFWYARTQFHTRKLLQPRPMADWRKIYRAVAASKRYSTPTGLWSISPAYLTGLDDLDSTLVLFELYGEPDWTSRPNMDAVWKKIRSRDVLLYLMNGGYISLGQSQGFQLCLEACSAAGCVEMVVALLDLSLEAGLPLGLYRAQEKAIIGGHLSVYRVLSQRVPFSSAFPDLAIRHGRTDVLAHMLANTHSADVDLDMVKLAIAREQIDVFYFLIETFSTDSDDLLKLMECALMCESSEFLEALADRSMEGIPNEQWRDWVFTAIGAGKEDVLEYILTQIELDEDDSDLIRVAGQYTGNGNLFPILLADERLDPTRDLVGTVKAMDIDSAATNIGLLMRDPRVRSEELGSDAAEAICAGLGLDVDETREMVIAGRDSYSLLLREMLFCGTKGEELKGWIERVVDKITPPIRALLSYMQYPEVSRTTQEWELRASGYSKVDLSQSLCLLGIYFACESEN